MESRTARLRRYVLPSLILLAAILFIARQASAPKVLEPDSGVPDEALTSAPATATVVPVEPDRYAAPFFDLAGAAQLAPPGIHELPSGRSQVIGILEYDSEQWRIVTRLPREGADALTGPVLLEDLDTFRHTELQPLRGAYVVAEGVLEDEPPGGSGGVLRTQAIHRIENPIIYESAAPGTVPEGQPDYGGKMLRGIPYRWATVEKPGLFEIGEGRVRLVGVLAFGSSGAQADSWMVADELPFWPGHFGSVAYLEEGFQPDGDADSWHGAYVAVEGVKVGERHRHGPAAAEPASAVVRVESIERLDVPEITPEERFH